MRSLSFQVDGVPVPKGSLTRMPNGAMLPAGTAQSRVRYGVWRIDLRAAAKGAMGDENLMTGALRVMIDCKLPYPKSLIRKWQMGWWPAKKKPDVDKLARGVLDHLKGIAWVDDSQVCWLTVNKRYAWDDKPGAAITIDEMPDDVLRELGEMTQKVEGMLNE